MSNRTEILKKLIYAKKEQNKMLSNLLNSQKEIKKLENELKAKKIEDELKARNRAAKRM